jgi:glucose-6-phosphate isomerase, archaeal
MENVPYSFNLVSPGFIPSEYDNHIQRHLSSLKGQYHDQGAFQEMLDKEDTLLYEVYELKRPEEVGELLHGVSIVHPGKVGDEYFMTKGHFHSVLDTAEVYFTLQGSGYMVMENPQGEWAVEELSAGRVLYVPPCWAHRSVNIGNEDLIMFFVYPGNAGHDYGTIEKQGFRKLILEQGGSALIADNPRWEPPEDR